MSSSLSSVSSLLVSSPPPLHHSANYPAPDALRLIGEYCVTARSLHRFTLVSQHYYASLSHPLCWRRWRLIVCKYHCVLAPSVSSSISFSNSYEFLFSSLKNVCSQHTLLKHLTHLYIRSFRLGAVLSSLLRLFPSFSSMTLEFSSPADINTATEWFSTLTEHFFSTALNVSFSSFPPSFLRRVVPTFFPSLIHLLIDGYSTATPVAIFLPSSLKHVKLDYNASFVLPSTIESFHCEKIFCLSHCSFTPDEYSLNELKYFQWRSAVQTITPTISAPQLESIIYSARRIRFTRPIIVPFLCSNLKHITLDLPYNTALQVFRFIPEHSVASLNTFHCNSISLLNDTHAASHLLFNDIFLQWSSTLPVLSSLKIISFFLPGIEYGPPAVETIEYKKKKNRREIIETFSEFCMKEAKHKFPVLEYVGEEKFIVTQSHYSSRPPVDLEEEMNKFIQERKKERE